MFNETLYLANKNLNQIAISQKLGFFAIGYSSPSAFSVGFFLVRLKVITMNLNLAKIQFDCGCQ